MRMTKAERKLFHACQGNCRACFWEGGCDLEKKVKRRLRRERLHQHRAVTV